MDTAAESAYAEYVAGHWASLVRAAVFLGASAHEAEDLAQTTLVRCYARWERVSAAENRDAYVYRMLLNALRDARRSRWWSSRVDRDLEEGPAGREAAGTAGADTAEAVAVADAVHRAMATLTRAHREVVVLRYFVQLSEAQTAAVLGIPPGTVKSRLSRSLSRLAESSHLHDLTGEHA